MNWFGSGKSKSYWTNEDFPSLFFERNEHTPHPTLSSDSKVMATPSFVFFIESFARDTRPSIIFQKLSSFGSFADRATRESPKAKQKKATATLKIGDLIKDWTDCNAMVAPVTVCDGFTGNKG
jgi:hypothetical protein